MPNDSIPNFRYRIKVDRPVISFNPKPRSYVLRNTYCWQNKRRKQAFLGLTQFNLSLNALIPPECRPPTVSEMGIKIVLTISYFG